MRSLAHPEYVYTPASIETRRRMRAANQKRLGIMEGACRIYGNYYPIELRDVLWKVASRAYRNRDPEHFPCDVWDAISDAHRAIVGEAAERKWLERICDYYRWE